MAHTCSITRTRFEVAPEGASICFSQQSVAAPPGKTPARRCRDSFIDLPLLRPNAAAQSHFCRILLATFVHSSGKHDMQYYLQVCSFNYMNSHILIMPLWSWWPCLIVTNYPNTSHTFTGRRCLLAAPSQAHVKPPWRLTGGCDS
jgi:hypothetical protein